MLKYFLFCLSVKPLISPSDEQMADLLGRVYLVADFFFPFYYFIYVVLILSGLKFLPKNSPYNLWEFPCMLCAAFPLLLLAIHLFSLLVIFITMCHSLSLFWLIPYGNLNFLNLSDTILSQVKEAFSYYVCTYFS